MTPEFLADRFVGCLVGMGVGDAMGQAADGMTPYEVMLAYRFVDGFFPKSGQDAGTTGYPFALAAYCSKSLKDSGMRVNLENMTKHLCVRSEWGPLQAGISEMTKGKPFEECGREYDLPDFLPFVIPIGLVAAAKGTKDDVMRASARTLSNGFCKTPSASVSALSICLVIRESVRDFENVCTPQELFDGKNSLLRRVISICKEAEPTSGMQEKDKVSSRLEYVISNLRQRTSIKEFVLSNGASSCAEVASSCLFCFASSPENFESVSKVASLGGRSSLCASLVAALVGAYSGANFLPKEMKEGLRKEPVMESMAKDLASSAWQAAQAKTGGTT